MAVLAHGARTANTDIQEMALSAIASTAAAAAQDFGPFLGQVRPVCALPSWVFLLFWFSLSSLV